jgi:FkbM family methyltransferase
MAMKPYLYLGGHRGVTVAGPSRICFDTRDVGMVNFVTSDAEYEPDVAAVLDRHLAPGWCFIDVGANVGIHTIRAGRLLRGSGRVLAFEPNAALVPLLRDNVALNGVGAVTTVRQAAVHQRAGRMTFSYETSQHRVGALVLEDAVNYGDASYEVDVVTLDAFAGEVGPDRPLLVKIDVEGREPGVIHGAEALLARAAETVVVMEYHQGVIASTGVDVAGFFGFLEARGFRPHRIAGGGLEATTFAALLGFQGHANIVLRRA